MLKPSDTSTVHYRCAYTSKKKQIEKSIELIGIDTEADQSGKCFMIATSLDDVFTLEEWPQFLFSRRYRGKKFACYNLKYDEGALLQHLPRDCLEELRKEGKTEYENVYYSIIPGKAFTIRRNKHTSTIYDLYTFFLGSLNYNAQKYLGEQKLEMDTTAFTDKYIKENWHKIGAYCVRDAELVERLARLLIAKFEAFGVFPRKLYSTAYVSYQYFSKFTRYVTVKRYWENNRKVLDYAMRSYNGGKFEVTQKVSSYLYEYDIISAYPAEIRNLVDITYARIVREKRYRRHASYGFIDCVINIPVNVHSPVALKYGTLNVYPVGQIHKTITKTEYEYLIAQGCDIEINEAYWLHIDNKKYPYRAEIDKLVAHKQRLNKEEQPLDYRTIKIFLNSLYGKFVQLIDKKTYWQASTCWNPIYGSVITANVRTRISQYQQDHPEIIAVHTDSLISKKPLPFQGKGELGDVIYECEGEGLILGSGVYQIGDKVRLRGFDYKTKLTDFIGVKKRSIPIETTSARSWREVVFHKWELERINRFETIPKKLTVDFDRKRIWCKDWRAFSDISDRPVYSLPHYNTLIGI